MRVAVVGPMEILGHAVRLALVAEALAGVGHDVTLAGSTGHRATVEALAPSATLVPCPGIGAFLATRAGYEGSPLEDARLLMANWRAIYRSNESLLDTIGPDLLVTDTSPAAAVAARRRGIPVLATTNAVWCGFHEGLSRTSRGHLEQACRVLGMTLRHATPFDGPPNAAFLGDRTLIYDLPVGVVDLPTAWPDEHTLWVGPLFPSYAGIEAQSGEARAAFVSFGSTGDADVAARASESLLAAGWHVRATCWGHGSSDPEAHAREMARANVVVTHGGSGTVYQAACFGRPVVVIPTNVEHFANADRVASLGIGLRTTLDRVSEACEDATGTGVAVDRLDGISQLLRAADPLAVVRREADRLLCATPPVHVAR